MLDTLKIDLPYARYEQVIALSDLDIAEKLAELENIAGVKTEHGLLTQPHGTLYQPITEPQTILQLMDKYEIGRKYEAYDFIGWGYWMEDGRNPIHILERQEFENRSAGNFSIGKCVGLAVLLNAHPDYQLPAALKDTDGGRGVTFSAFSQQFSLDANAQLTLLQGFTAQHTGARDILHQRVTALTQAHTDDTETLFSLLREALPEQERLNTLAQVIIDSHAERDLARFVLQE